MARDQFANLEQRRRNLPSDGDGYRSEQDPASNAAVAREERAYQEGYSEGTAQGRYEDDIQSAREMSGSGSGRVIGVLLTAVAGLILATVYLAPGRNVAQPPEVPTSTSPSPTVAPTAVPPTTSTQPLPNAQPTVQPSVQTPQTGVITPTQTAPPQVIQPSVPQAQPTQPQVPQVTQPSVVQPQVTQPQVTQPQVTQPPVIQSPVVQPSVMQPPVTQPQVTQPPVTQPITPPNSPVVPQPTNPY
jgi:hypothetical protein